MNNKTALLLILDQEKINMGEKRKTGKIRTPWERDKPASMVGGKGQDPKSQLPGGALFHWLIFPNLCLQSVLKSTKQC